MIATQRYKHSGLLFTIYCCVLGYTPSIAQLKLDKKIPVRENVVVQLNTSHTDVVFETWDKNTVQVVARLKGNQNTSEHQEQILNQWKLETSGDENKVIITSTEEFYNRSVDVAQAKEILQGSTQELKMLAPMITDMLKPIMKNIEEHPMPNALQGNIQQEISVTLIPQTNAYLEQWELQMKDKFGDDFDKVMKDWSKQFAENATLMNGQIQTNMQDKASNAGMNAWRKQFEKQMEVWASQFAKEFSVMQNVPSTTVVYQKQVRNSSSYGSKNMIVKIPKTAKLELNMRYGMVQLPEELTNIKGSLSYTKLSADVIDGTQTYIKASYAPVFVKEWNNGKLVINYVKNCRIENAKNLLMNADSSTIFIQELNDSGSVSGNFTAITIANLGQDFSTLDLAVNNSDIRVKLPESSFNLMYNGNQSRIVLPKTLETNVRQNFGNVFINGYQQTRDTDNVLTVNAKYSDVILE